MSEMTVLPSTWAAFGASNSKNWEGKSVSLGSQTNVPLSVFFMVMELAAVSETGRVEGTRSFRTRI